MEPGAAIVDSMSHTAAAPLSPEAVLLQIAEAHPLAMDPGLDRLRAVAARAGLDRIEHPLAIVAGTNGKGSTVVCLEAIWRAAGRRTGAFLSPHLIRFNERIRIDGEEASDVAILAAIARIRSHIGPDTLTYFELAALVAVACFIDAGCDAIVLEVGLGGRLDATNLWDANGAILTSVALDHADWLGTDLGVIATEKAAVARAGTTLVVGERNPPSTLAPWAAQTGVTLVGIEDELEHLTNPRHLAGEHHRRNAACAAVLARSLDSHVAVSESDIVAGLRQARLPGRLQPIHVDGVDVIVDVAHNPAAAEAIAGHFGVERLHLVFASLGDKDMLGIARALVPSSRSIACAALDSDRALSAAELVAKMRSAIPAGSDVPCEAHASVELAWEAAATRARADGARVLVVGSHVTVGDWLAMRGGLWAGASQDALSISRCDD